MASLPGSTFHRMCSHCGSEGARRIGFCHECGGPVCEKCGNVQHTQGETYVMHDSCLKFGESSSFSMIKFVK